MTTELKFWRVGFLTRLADRWIPVSYTVGPCTQQDALAEIMAEHGKDGDFENAVVEEVK